MIDVFFNRPDRPLHIDEMIEDIEHATQRLVIASAWFTDAAIAQVVVDAPAPCKLVFLNNADKARGNRLAVQRLYQGLRPEQIIVLGGESFEEGIMHHKWCLIDAATVWVGSYNFTMAARRNFETLLRIRETTIAEQFWAEAEALLTYQGSVESCHDVPAACIRCGQLVGYEFQVFEYDGILCKTCHERVYEQY